MSTIITELVVWLSPSSTARSRRASSAERGAGGTATRGGAPGTSRGTSRTSEFDSWLRPVPESRPSSSRGTASMFARGGTLAVTPAGRRTGGTTTTRSLVRATVRSCRRPIAPGLGVGSLGGAAGAPNTDSRARSRVRAWRRSSSWAGGGLAGATLRGAARSRIGASAVGAGAAASVAPIVCACSAAPRAITSSGLTSVRGSRPKCRATWSRMYGSLVVPPTSTTSSRPASVSPARWTASSHTANVRSTTSAIARARSSRVISSLRSSGLPSGCATPSMRTVVVVRRDSSSLVCSASPRRRSIAAGLVRRSSRWAALIFWTSMSTICSSRSSPPSAPWLAVPRVWGPSARRRTIVTSNAPAPKS